MEVLEAIKKRRSIRTFTKDKIPEDVMNRLLEAIQLAPSGGNRQSYKFIIVKDDEMKMKLADACRWNPGATSGQKFLADAPIIVVACALESDAIVRFTVKDKVYLATGQDVPQELDKATSRYHSLADIDAAIAIDHLTLAATSEGLGTCWIAAMDEKEIKELLAIPDEMRVPFITPIGYTSNWPEARPRKKLDELICYEKYC